MQDRKLQIFSGTSSGTLGALIAEHYGVKLGNLELQRFSDGEMQPRFGESIRGHNVYLVQSLYAPADNLMELFLMIDAAVRSSAHTVNVVTPYFGYARQDRKDQPRVSIGAKLVANLLQAAGAQRVITMDLHAGQIQGFFDIPVDNLEATTVFIPYIKGLNLENITICSPDMGGVTRARKFAQHLDANLVLVDKYRVRANEVSTMQLIGEVTDRNVIIVDDIVDTGGTLAKAADYLMEQGARSVRAAITHPILSGPAVERIENSKLAELLTTDTIPHGPLPDKIRVLTISPIFAQALKNIHNHESVSSLFLN